MTADLRERERPTAPAELGGVILLIVFLTVLTTLVLLTS